MEENEIDQELVEELRVSKAKLGALSPIILDASGKIVEGNHRRKADPNWPTITYEEIRTEEQRILYAIAFNWHRREKTESWKSKMLNLLASKGYTPGEIIEKTGLSERTVYRYLSGEHKASEPKQLASARLALSSKSEDTKLSVLCARCGEPIQGAPIHLGGGKYYDAECAEAVVAEARTGHGPSIEPGTGDALRIKEGQSEEGEESKAEEELPEREALKAIQIGEFECTECHKRFFVHHLPNGKHKLEAIRQEES